MFRDNKKPIENSLKKKKKGNCPSFLLKGQTRCRGHSREPSTEGEWSPGSRLYLLTSRSALSSLTTQQEPVTTVLSSLSTQQEPVITVLSSLTTQQEPVTTALSNLSTQQEPVTAALSSLTTQQEPVTTSQSSLTTQQEPATTTADSIITTTGSKLHGVLSACACEHKMLVGVRVYEKSKICFNSQ